jgi:hypothetical protein
MRQETHAAAKRGNHSNSSGVKTGNLQPEILPNQRRHQSREEGEIAQRLFPKPRKMGSRKFIYQEKKEKSSRSS